MKIKKVEWRNFSSYGNKKQILEFPETPSLFQIVGENGAGKSSISQVITFALYGKLEGKKLSDIPNRINGNAWVRLEFESNGREVAVVRGLEPSVFELWIDGLKYDQAGQRSVQDYLADDILGIPFYVFNNTILLSINDFKSFIKMSTQDKRAIVDKIFGFHILNQMRDLLKEESKKIKEEMDRISGQIDSVLSSIQKSNSELEDLLSEIERESTDQVNNLKEALEKLESIKSENSKKMEDLCKEESNVRALVNKSDSSLLEAKGRYKDVGRKLSLYNNDKCPTCETSLDTEFHMGLKKELEDEYKKAEDEIKNLEKSNLEIKKIESDLNKSKMEIREKSIKIQSRIATVEEELLKIQSPDAVDSQVKSLKRIVGKLEADRDNLMSENFKTEEKSNWVKKLDEILGEKGVKQMAIKTILPSLNSEILELLGEMHLNYQVVFDEEFKATVYHMGIEIPVQTLSTGEMKKVDFVVLVAIMKLMKMKFSSINILFLDELFSSVDPDGIHSILKILRKITRDLGLNIFVINHAPMPHEIFDWKLDVSKTNNFSSISMEKF
jgi:DNA repair exonuclease SbcCD ATPase subunit